MNGGVAIKWKGMLPRGREGALLLYEHEKAKAYCFTRRPAHFFSKGPQKKYFRLPEPYHLKPALPW